MADQAIISQSRIVKPAYYVTETQWREHTGFVNTIEFPSNEIAVHLRNATEQVKRTGFQKLVEKLIIKDNAGRYWLPRRFITNAVGADRAHGTVTPIDITLKEADAVSSAMSNLHVGRIGRVNRIYYDIPNTAITEIDPYNSYVKISSDYPTTSSRQIYATYWFAGKPLAEIDYELKMACIEYTTFLALMKLKTKRLKKGVVSYTIGKQSVNRNEPEFDKLMEWHLQEFQIWCNIFKPFYGRRVSVGKMETTSGRHPGRLF